MQAATDPDIQTVFREYMSLERQREAQGITPQETERWSELKRRLSMHFQPDLELRHADRRGSIRVPTRIELRYESQGSMGDSLMTNLSRNGLFVTTSNPLPIGARVEMHILVENGDEEFAVDVLGEVTSHHTGTDLYGDQFGMGIGFSNLTDLQRKRIDDLYEHSIQRAVGLSES